jgi:hypothetical protein
MDVTETKSFLTVDLTALLTAMPSPNLNGAHYHQCQTNNLQKSGKFAISPP